MNEPCPLPLWGCKKDILWSFSLETLSCTSVIQSLRGEKCKHKQLLSPKDQRVSSLYIWRESAQIQLNSVLASNHPGLAPKTGSMVWLARCQLKVQQLAASDCEHQRRSGSGSSVNTALTTIRFVVSLGRSRRVTVARRGGCSWKSRTASRRRRGTLVPRNRSTSRSGGACDDNIGLLFHN